MTDKGVVVHRGDVIDETGTIRDQALAEGVTVYEPLTDIHRDRVVRTRSRRRGGRVQPGSEEIHCGPGHAAAHTSAYVTNRNLDAQAWNGDDDIRKTRRKLVAERKAINA